MHIDFTYMALSFMFVELLRVIFSLFSLFNSTFFLYSKPYSYKIWYHVCVSYLSVLHNGVKPKLYTQQSQWVKLNPLMITVLEMIRINTLTWMRAGLGYYCHISLLWAQIIIHCLKALMPWLKCVSAIYLDEPSKYIAFPIHPLVSTFKTPGYLWAWMVSNGGKEVTFHER